MRGRYELECWELLNMHYPSQLELQCKEGFVSTVASVCTHCEKQSTRWVWEGRGCPCRDALQWWDCLWFSPADTMMNCGYCQDVLEHMEELVDNNSDLLRTSQWCMNVTYCSCQYKSAACVWVPSSIHVFSNEMVRSTYPHSTEKSMKRQPVFVWVCFCVPIGICFSLIFVIHIKKQPMALSNHLFFQNTDLTSLEACGFELLKVEWG